MDSKKTKNPLINAEIVLASTLHDTDNRLEESIIKYGSIIRETFQSSSIVVTPSTNRQIVNTLNGLGFETSKGSKTIISAYKKALKQALTNNPKHIFYCDFDRILHWVDAFPQELIETARTSYINDFLLIGRTTRAFQTHPKTQIETEIIANQLASKLLGFRQTRDILSVCWRLTSTLAETLLQLPTRNSYGFYVEWPVYAWQHADNPCYIEVDGLEWETPDKYGEEIKKMGYEAWLKAFKSPKNGRSVSQCFATGSTPF